MITERVKFNIVNRLWKNEVNGRTAFVAAFMNAVTAFDTASCISAAEPVCFGIARALLTRKPNVIQFIVVVVDWT